MKILIVDNGTKYLAKLKLLTLQYLVTIKKYSDLVQSDQSAYDLIILSGGHSLSVIGHDTEYAKEITLIQQTSTPILGICLGFELIAHTFGAKMLRMHKKERGILNIKPELDDPIFTRIQDMKVFESHRWIVTQAGDQLISLARSRDGVEIIRHAGKLIYGFQFHPEMFEYQTQGDELFANFMKIVQNKYL